MKRELSAQDEEEIATALANSGVDDEKMAALLREIVQPRDREGYEFVIDAVRAINAANQFRDVLAARADGRMDAKLGERKLRAAGEALCAAMRPLRRNSVKT